MQEKKYKKDRSRSRSRQRRKNRKNDRSHSQSSKSSCSISMSRQQQQHLTLVVHNYYEINDIQSISPSLAIWNFCLKFSSRLSHVLISCESIDQLVQFKHTYNLQRQLLIVEQDSKHPDLFQKIVRSEIILTTQKRCAIMIALEQCQQLFEIVINAGKCTDGEFYINISQITKSHGSIITFIENGSALKQLSRKLNIDFKVVTSEISNQNLNNQLIESLKLLPNPSTEQLRQISLLPFSLEQAAARLLMFQHKRRQKNNSIFMKIPNYTTYILLMGIQFNSLKYVWNYLKKIMPPSLVKQIRMMSKLKNQKGAIFNIPRSFAYHIQLVKQQLRNKKVKNIQLYQIVGEIPELEDTNTQQYKQTQQKRKLALEKKGQLQIFIAGLPYQMDQDNIKQFFIDQKVSLFLVRILKDQKGFSKGIAFGICEDKEHFNRAMSLNGRKLGDRGLRIKLATQKQKDH